MYLLGVDLGTTGCKSMLFDEKGGIVAEQYIEYDLIMTPEGVEQNAGDWWENVQRTIRAVTESAAVPGEQIAALCVCSQGIAFVPVDRAGNPLYNALSWLDGRSTEQTARMRALFGDAEVYRRTGKNLLAYLLPQAAWLKRYRPEVMDKADKLLMAHDYIVFRLTGEQTTDLSMAAGTLAFDIHEHCWIEEYIQAMGLDVSLFPRLGVMGEPVGCVRAEVAEALGLSEKTLVVMGAQDQRCASIGAGIKEGVFTVSIGTASAICAMVDAPLLDEQGRIPCCALDRSHWVLESVVDASGVALKWLRNTLFPGESFAGLDALAAQSPAGANGVSFYPHLTGAANGAFWGLSLSTTRADIVRAVLEGVAMQIALHIRQMERAGVWGDEIRIFGGGAKSPLWRQIIADATGKRVAAPRTYETANLGAAALAGLGAGLLKDGASIDAFVGEPAARFVPDPANADIYQELLAAYQINNEAVQRRR